MELLWYFLILIKANQHHNTIIKRVHIYISQNTQHIKDKIVLRKRKASTKMALNFRIQDSFPTLNKSCHNKRGTRNRKHVVQVYTPPEDGADPTRGDDNTGALFDVWLASDRFLPLMVRPSSLIRIVFRWRAVSSRFVCF